MGMCFIYSYLQPNVIHWGMKGTYCEVEGEL